MYRRNRAILGKKRRERLLQVLASDCLPEDPFESIAQVVHEAMSENLCRNVARSSAYTAREDSPKMQDAWGKSLVD